MRAVMTRALALLPTSLVLFLLLAPAALATQEPISGEGTYGPADDKVVTNAGFIDHHLLPAVHPLHEPAPVAPGQAQGSSARRSARSCTADRRWQSGW